MLEMNNEVIYLVLLTLDVNWLRNKLSRVSDLPPLIWRICPTYLEDLPPLFWMIYHHLSGGSATTYLEDLPPLLWFTVEIRLTQPQVELELGLSLAITLVLSTNLNMCH
jgi:hypothetical protein